MADPKAEFASLVNHILPQESVEETDEQIPEPALDAIDQALAESQSESSESESESESDESSESESDEASDSDSEEREILAPPDSPDEIPRTKNELDEAIPVLPEGFTMTEETRIEPIGAILSVGDRSVVIKTETSGEYRILAEGTIFCLEDRTVLGPLFETFGPVEHPLYVVKFATEEETNGLKDKIGQQVCYVVPSSNYVFTETLKSKGSDASNFHDEEVPLEEQEYSDDEQEALAKQSKKKRKRKPASQPPAKSIRPAQETRTTQPVSQPFAPQGFPMQNPMAAQQAAQQAAQWYYYQALAQAQAQAQAQNQNQNPRNPRGGPPSAAPPY